MKPVYRISGILLLIAVAAFLFVVSGAYNVAADEPHWTVTHFLMQKVRENSIAHRAAGVIVPPLEDESLITSGAGNYEAMCAGCHLKPGTTSTEMSRGLYPAPPNLTGKTPEDPAAAYWVIKHGIKMSAMPAWGKSMEDHYVWGLVAFIRKLPELTPDQYHELVEASGGHHHGGSESGTEHGESGAEHEHEHEHEHEAGAEAHDDDHSNAPPHQH